MVDEAVELVGWRIEPFRNIGARTVGPEVMKNGPGTDLQFGRRAMSMKEASVYQPAIHGVHVAINHVVQTHGSAPKKAR